MIIGFSGKIKSGKSTMANMLMDHLIRNKLQAEIQLRHFADSLKEISSYLTGVSKDVLCTQDGKDIYLEKWGMTTGEFLQWFGTDVCRTHNPDVWVDIAMRGYNSGEHIFIFDDVRFENEADAIIRNGGIVIRLDGDPTKTRSLSSRDQDHKSETELDDYNGFVGKINSNQSKEGTLTCILEIITKYFYENETRGVKQMYIGKANRI